MKMQAYTTNGGDAPSLALSSPGLTVRSKPASFIRVQDAEPMYKQRMYSDGQVAQAIAWILEDGLLRRHHHF